MCACASRGQYSTGRRAARGLGPPPGNPLTWLFRHGLPRRTARFTDGPLERLSLGGGAYYTGERPINDWSAGAVTHEGIVPGQKPFNVNAYTLVNLQAAYQINANWNVRLLANNIFDEVGYNAYRTSYINQTDPRTFAGVLTYTF